MIKKSNKDNTQPLILLFDLFAFCLLLNIWNIIIENNIWFTDE